MDWEREEPIEAEEYEVEGSEQENLEAAMREALEAVEGTRDKTAAGGADGDDGPPSSPESEAPTDELTMLRQEVAELRDRSVRTLADFDNFRKRAERERDEQQRYAGSEVLRDFLPVVDNLERALDSGADTEELRSGVELILRQIVDLLRRHGVERVEAEGEVFDPGVHEAVSRQESATVDVATVSEEFQAGYVMKGRLLRPAMVVVAVPKAAPGDDQRSD